MTKVLLTKIGNYKIDFPDNIKAGPSGEFWSIYKMLVQAGYYVTTDLDAQHDFVVCLNGLITEEEQKGTQAYDVIQALAKADRLNKRIFYLHCDPMLWFKSYLYPELASKVIYLTQSRRTDKVKEYADYNVVRHFPFEKFVLLNQRYSGPVRLSDCQYDLMYGGSYRFGRRADDMIRFYFGHNELSACMFGHITLDRFDPAAVEGLTPPVFEDQVPYNEFGKNMRRSVATVTIADPLYIELYDFNQRIYETILAGNVVFFDKRIDPDGLLIKDENLRKTLYVESREDVERVLHKISQQEVGRLSNLLYDEIAIDTNEYIEQFRQVLENFV